MNKIAYEVPQDYFLSGNKDSLKLVWHIECDSDQTLTSVRTLTGVPYLGAQSPLAANLFAARIRFCMRSSRYFRAEVEYSSVVPQFAAGENLSLRAPEIRYFDECEFVPLERCFSGDESEPLIPVLNSAGDLFPEVPMIPKLRQRIEISWYAASVNTTRMYQCFNTLNKEAVTMDGIAYGVESLWCVRLQTTPQCNSAGTEYTKVELTLRYHPDNWNIKLLQSGFQALDANGQKHPIRLWNGAMTAGGDQGVRITDPALLDAGGHLLGDGSSAVYGEFRFLRRASWSALNIPSARATHRSIGG